MKKFSKLLLVFALLLGLISLLVTSGFAQTPPASSPDFVPGEILVKFQPHVNEQAAQRSLQSSGMRAAEVSPYSGVIRIKVAPGREQEAINKLLARGDVEFAALNRYLYATLVPNDADYGNQWALSKIEGPAAWDISTGSSDIIVAIVDSGLDTSHVEFLGRIVSPRDEIDNDSVPQDFCTHGTHVAGIAAAKGNNSVGVAGLTWNSKVMPIRTLTGSSSSNCSGSEANIAKGIDYAVNHGARIINLSLGGTRDFGKTCEQTYPAMSQAVQNALNAGILVVAAAGNNGSSSILCPAAMDGVMAVGSTTSFDSRSSFSNFGPELDIAAPGSFIYSTIPGGYGYKDGTSMATPHVSGLAALLWSVSSSLTKDQVRDLIQNNAVDLGTPGWDQYFGHGRINAWNSMQALSFQSSPAQLTLLLDDKQNQTSGSVQVTTLNTDVITWTASISPPVSWLSIHPSTTTGTLSAATSPTAITLLAQSSPLTYTDTPTNTTLVINGTTASGANLSTSSNVQLIYQSELYRYYFPLIFKN